MEIEVRKAPFEESEHFNRSDKIAESIIDHPSKKGHFPFDRYFAVKTE